MRQVVEGTDIFRLEYGKLKKFYDRQPPNLAPWAIKIEGLKSLAIDYVGATPKEARMSEWLRRRS